MRQGAKIRLYEALTPLIDDDPSIHALVKGILAPESMKITSALDPTQALQFVRKETPDLIVLDIQMPAGGGVELYKRLKSLPASSSIPILVISGLSEDEIKAKIDGLSNEQVLSKPIEKDSLLRHVRSLLA